MILIALVGAAALFFVGMGVAGLVAPAWIASLFGGELTADGRNESRAVYGGFGVASGVALALALCWPRFLPGALMFSGAAVVGMALGRLVSLGIDRRAGFYPRLFFVVELGLAACLFGGLALVSGRAS